MLRTKLKLVGVPETERQLNGYGKRVRNAVLGKGLTEAARAGVRAAKNMLKRRRTGLLGKSLAYKMSPTRKNGGYRVIGADRGFATSVPGSSYETNHKKGAKVELSGKKRKGKLRTISISRKAMNVVSGLKLNPSKYAHLVEGGRKENKAINFKFMRFRVAGRGASKMVFAKKVKAVRPQPFMKPASQYLKLVYPYIIYKHVKAAA